MDITGVIYKFTCIETGKSYIGQTIHPKERFISHIKSVNNLKLDTHFVRALRKHRYRDYSILEKDIPRNNLDDREKYWISYFDSYHNGYNSTIGGGSYIPTEETKVKISKALTGIKRSDETRQKLSNLQKGRKKPPISNETRKKLSEVWKGRKRKPFSEEHRRKLSESHKGKIPWNKKKDESDTINT